MCDFRGVLVPQGTVRLLRALFTFPPVSSDDVLLLLASTLYHILL